MESIFDRNDIVPGLPGIILLSHGPLALGMLETTRLITDNTKNMAAFTVEAGDSPEDFAKAFAEAIELLPDEVIIFTDMMSGTPCNQLLLASASIDKPFLSFAGMNLPLVSEAVFMRRICSGQELEEAIMQAGAVSIVNLRVVIEELRAGNST